MKKWIITCIVIICILVLSMLGILFIYGDKTTKSKNKGEESEVVALNTWAEVTKYNNNTSKDENVKVRITSVTKGPEAEAIVRSYAETNGFVEYTGVYQGMQLIVAEYEIDFSSYTPNKFGENVDIEASVVNKEGKDVSTDKKVYKELPIRNISAEEKVDMSKTSVGYIEFQVPTDATSVALKIGSENGTKKIFNID